MWIYSCTYMQLPCTALCYETRTKGILLLQLVASKILRVRGSALEATIDYGRRGQRLIVECIAVNPYAIIRDEKPIWLILPAVICFVQGLSHANVRVHGFFQATVGL